MRVILKTKGTVLPVTSASLRDWVRTSDTTAENKIIKGLALDGANRFQQYTGGNTIMDHTYQVYYDLRDLFEVMDADVLELPHEPVNSITSIKTFDVDDASTTLTVDDDYQFITGDNKIKFDDSFSFTGSPRDNNTILIEYKTGYVAGAVPDDLIHSLKMYAAWAYNHRGDEQLNIPDQITEYWAPYVIHRFGSAI